VPSLPITVCHRGASALAPENSLAAFRLAMAYGVDYSELDVHLSRDGQLIVTHDAVYEHDGRPIDATQLPAAELDVPRLVDVFELVRGRMGLYVELKGDGTARVLATCINAGAAQGVTLIAGSFRRELVAELRQAAPEVPSSILFGAGWDTAEMIAACHELGVTYAHPCVRPAGGWRPLVDALHAAGLQVMTPHTNDALEARYFAALGVEVIASDDPRVVLALREQFGHPAPSGRNHL
jgi:glycerophosphoryl diester phosphodiesterase